MEDSSEAGNKRQKLKRGWFGREGWRNRWWWGVGNQRDGAEKMLQQSRAMHFTDFTIL